MVRERVTGWNRKIEEKGCEEEVERKLLDIQELEWR